MEKSWVFPYADIEKGSAVIIYGAGNVGNSFFRQNEATCYCKVVAWVDAQFEYYQSKGLEVLDPSLISQYHYDNILVAIDSPDTSRTVVAYLKDIGVETGKIWSPYIQNQEEEREAYSSNSTIDDCYLKNKPDISHLRIAVIIPEPIKGGGGHRNIFRVVKKMADSGHEVCVYCYHSNKSAKINKDNSCSWFYDLSNVKFVNYTGSMGTFDVGIATWWETAYVLKEHENCFRNIYYFVQDYEPFFYPLSANYILAENTYKFGYKHICSGPWCERMLRDKYKADTVSFQFPLDRNIYNDTYERRKTNKNILFFAKPEMPRRCFEIGIQALEIFHKSRPDVEIVMFGSRVLNKRQVPFEATIRNIVPTLKELAQMYTNADLGIVFSVTNPSLVPYEMISCGLPVVDLNVEYALSKYGDDEDNVFLFDSLPEKFAGGLLEIIDDSMLLAKKSKHAMEWVKREFPDENEMSEFVESVIVDSLRDK